MEKVISDKSAFPDDLNDYTYDLMEGIVGKKNMTFERASNNVPVVGDSNHLRPAYYAISNDRYVSYPKLNCVVAFDPHESIGKTGYIYPIIVNYPNLDNASNNVERESIVKAAYEKQGLIEHVDFEFVSIEKLQSMVNEHNRALITENVSLEPTSVSIVVPVPSTGDQLTINKNDIAHYGHIDYLSNSGNVVETNYFKDKKSFDKEVSASIDVGRPIIWNIDKQFKDQIIDMYSKEFPAIRHISEKTARGIDALNTQNGQPLTIKEIKKAYTAAGKNLEAVPSDTNMDIFDKYKDVVDGIKQAQSLDLNEKAQEKALLNPSKSKVMEMSL